MNGIRRRDVISKSQEYREFLFDQCTFGAGTFHDSGRYSEHSIIPNLYNNTDGIRLKGVSRYAPGFASWADQEYWDSTGNKNSETKYANVRLTS